MNFEHEHALIAACFRYGDVLDRVLAEFQYGDFVDQTVNEVYHAMSVIRDRGESVDLVSVANEMSEHRRGMKLPPIVPVVSMWMELPALPELNLDGYFKMVRDGKLRERLQQAAIGISEMVSHPDVEHALDRAQDLVLALSSQRSLGGVTGFGEMETSMDESPVISTGVPAIDERIGGGLRRSEMVIIGARTRVGKTTLGMNIAANVAKDGGRTLVFSLEMAETSLLERLISAESGVPKFAFEKGLHDESVRKLYYGLPRIWSLPLLVDTTAALSVSEIKGRARRAGAKKPLDLVVVDYAQLIKPEEKNESRARQVAGVMEALRAMAKELNVPVIAMSQINRAGGQDDTLEPELHNLSESSGIENTADVVILLWRKSAEAKEALESHRPVPTHAAVKKNRHGSDSWWTMLLDGPHCRFIDA